MKRQINRIDSENPETDTDAHSNLVYVEGSIPNECGKTNYSLNGFGITGVSSTIKLGLCFTSYTKNSIFHRKRKNDPYTV